MTPGAPIVGNIVLPPVAPIAPSEAPPVAAPEPRKILPLVAKSPPASSLQSSGYRATSGKSSRATSGTVKQSSKRATSGKGKRATLADFTTTPVVEIRQTSRNVCGVFFRFNQEPGRPLIKVSNISAVQYTALQEDKPKYEKFRSATIAFHAARVVRTRHSA